MISVDGPARHGSGNGLPVPNRVMRMLLGAQQPSDRIDQGRLYLGPCELLVVAHQLQRFERGEDVDGGDGGCRAGGPSSLELGRKQLFQLTS